MDKIKKVYIDSRYTTNDSVSNSNSARMLYDKTSTAVSITIAIASSDRTTSRSRVMFVVITTSMTINDNIMFASIIIIINSIINDNKMTIMKLNLANNWKCSHLNIFNIFEH